jgi:hypothetical protein
LAGIISRWQAWTDGVIPHLETLPSLTMLTFDDDGVLTPAGVERIGRLLFPDHPRWFRCLS